MMLDKMDWHLLCLLDMDSRASLTDLSSELRISREAVNYRIKRLERAGIITAFLTRLDLKKLGLTMYVTYLKLANLNEAEYEKFVNKLVSQKSITWVATIGGQFDLAIEMGAQSADEFDANIAELNEEYAENIASYQISTNIFQTDLGKKFLWPEKVDRTTLKMNPRSLIQDKIEIDGLDKKIIGQLSVGARKSAAQISKKINEPPSTVSFRIKQLEKAGVINAYITFSQLEKIGFSKFKTLISVRKFSKSDEKTLFGFCCAHPNIYYFNKTIGKWNYEMEVAVDSRDPRQYQRFLIEFRSRFGDVIQDVETLQIFEEKKWTFWPY